jgi:ParB/RepB/Spo0J family partition protein
MPKMEAASLTINISLAQIVDTGNIREKEKYSPNEKGEWPQDIIDLATSIKTIGLLQPINVRSNGEIDGVKMYEITSGNRRRAAHEYLVSQGEDFNQIAARIITGNKTAIQLVENIQRENLTAQETETAIFQLTETMKQKEIAAQLSKTPAYVSVNVSAYKIRKKGIKE